MIPGDPPIAGTVIRYNYLWAYQKAAGREAGDKDRPVALIVAKRAEDGACVVLPITHREPEGDAFGYELPENTRRRLGLDSERSWVILNEINHFVWPGPNLRPVPGAEPETVVYGQLSKRTLEDILTRFQTLLRARRVRSVPRGGEAGKES